MKPAKKYYCIPLAILCAFIIYIIMIFLYFPKELKLLENTAHRFDFGFPMEATISAESIAALNVNSEPVTENITVDLSKPLVIESGETGKADMTLRAFGFPLKSITLDVLPDMELIPCGMTIGVNILTDGVMVLGTGPVNGIDGSAHKPCDGILKSGDLITHVNGVSINNSIELKEIIESSEEVHLNIKRENQSIQASIPTVKCIDDNLYKIGVWLRDNTQGIGTVTYYNPVTKNFGALGHGVVDVDTKKIIVIKSGVVMESEISSVKSGKKGVPGELVGEVKTDKVIGEIYQNTTFGLYGKMNFDAKLPSKKMKIGMQDQVHKGPATILSNIEKAVVKEYDIYIEGVNRYSADNSKGMVIRITDPELITKTGGIVQGMSGSPIIQDGRIIGAVTHVFVQDPTKGYGIFIEHMLKQENYSEDTQQENE